MASDVTAAGPAPAATAPTGGFQFPSLNALGTMLKRGDIALAVGVLTILVVLILPLPPIVLDLTRATVGQPRLEHHRIEVGRPPNVARMSLAQEGIVRGIVSQPERVSTVRRGNDRRTKLHLVAQRPWSERGRRRAEVGRRQ